MDPDQQLHTFVNALGTIVFLSIIAWHIISTAKSRTAPAPQIQ